LEDDSGPEIKGYTFYESASAPYGGVRTPMKAEKSAGMLPYISVRSIEKTLQKIKTARGKVLVPKTEIPPGWFAVFRAPGGVIQALLESK
jgi:predicted enzyme related to lactoylglutathione lyase